jgi:hypothetical protein
MDRLTISFWSRSRSGSNFRLEKEGHTKIKSIFKEKSETLRILDGIYSKKRDCPTQKCADGQTSHGFQLITTTSQGSAFEEVQNFFFDFSQKNN